MRVSQARSWSAQDVAESYALWWREAGLHCAAAPQPHGWLAEPANETAPGPVAETAAPAPRFSEPAPVALAPMPAGAMPDSLPAFLDWLAHDAGQPEAAWAGPMFLPPQIEQPRLLVICDMPDEALPEGPLPFAAPTARFVTAMLAAIGLDAQQAAFAPLAMRRPPGGLLDETAIATLAGRMRHYLGLARPRAALLLGDRTGRALIAPQAQPSSGSLPAIDHAAGRLAAAALAAPELLMRRPMAKAASWQTLRLLHDAIGH